MSDETKAIERRLFRIGVGLVAAGGLCAWIFFSSRVAGSFLMGGAAALLNFVWFQKVAAGLVLTDAKATKRRALGGYFLRLMLIPLALYAIIRSLFLTVPAAVAGFAVFYCSVFIEGILEAFTRTSK